MNGLKIDNITITHRGGVVAASDFSLEVSMGSAKVLAGPIGSGKSSILRAIAGLVDFEGQIIFNDKSLHELSTRDRNFVYASHDSPLFYSKTLEYNLAFGAKLRKVQNISARVGEIAQLFGLNSLLSSKVRSLSYIQQRFSIVARAFIRDADLYLFNDITRGLDEPECAIIVDNIGRIFSTKNTTMLIATSDYTATASLGYKTAIIKDGIKLCEGDPDYFRSAKLDRFTELFTQT